MEQVKKEKIQPNKRMIAVIAAVLLVAVIVIVIAVVSDQKPKKQSISMPFGVEFGVSESEMISLMEKNGFTYDGMAEISDTTAAYQFTGKASLYGGTTSKVIIAAASGTINYQVTYPKDQLEDIRKAVTEQYGEPKDMGEGLIWEGEKCVMILYSSVQNPSYCMLHIALSK